MKKLFILILSCFAYQVNAQDLETYTRLQSEGPIPDIFVTLLDQKISEDDNKLKSESTISTKNAREFSAITNYKLQQLIRGGKVLYGDPLTNYANGVLDKLKAASNNDLDHIQLYTLKSNEVNAFATHQGVIFITVGLIGQLENEAQLAFILAHELTHVIEKHSQLTYQHTQDLIKKSRYGDGTISDYYQYSKENEEEADEAGFKLAIKAGYNESELYNAFLVLLYSYLPIDEQPLDYSQFENTSYNIHEKLKLEKEDMNEISPEEDVDDEFHTHPNISKRRKNARAFLKDDEKEHNKKTYIFGTEESFKNLRTVARFEMLNIFIQQADYVKGLNHSMIMRKQYPNNKFLVKGQSMIWYGLSAYESRANDIPFSFSYRKKEGEIQSLYYFLNKLKDRELSTLATQQIWQNSLNNPDDMFLKQIRKEVLKDFVSYDNNDLKFFATKAPEGNKDVETDKPKDTKLNKYDKIAKKRKTESTVERFHYALLNVINDADFQNEVDDAIDEVKKDEDNREELEESNYKPQKNTMDVTSLIMTTPNYYASDGRKSTKDNVKKNDMTEGKLIDAVQENAKELNISLSFIDNFRDPNFSTENYNEFSLLYDYLGERTKFDEMDFLPFNSQYTSTLTDKYNSNYVAMVGIYTEIEPRPFNVGAALLSIFTLYTFPLYLKWQLTVDKSTDYGFYIMNLNTNNPAFSSSKYFHGDMNIHLQSAQIYNSLNQIKK